MGMVKKFLSMNVSTIFSIYSALFFSFVNFSFSAAEAWSFFRCDIEKHL